MAAITSPQAVVFCNERARPMADLLEKTRRTAEQFLIEIVEFESETSGNGNSDTISDGAATDGRRVITKGDVLGLKYVAEQIVAASNQDDRETLVANVSVNGTPIF